MAQWGFLTSHARALLYVAGHPDARLRDLAEALDATERTAYGIVADLVTAGYVLKSKDGRRNRYRVQTHLPLPDSAVRKRTIGEMLELLSDSKAGREQGSARSQTPTRGAR